MTQAYSVNCEDIILLVGEGNFSFTKDFLLLIEKTLQNERCGTKLVTSCREDQFETFSEFKKQNIKYLQNKGVIVLFNVDATKLISCELLQYKKFTKVIFNFPHIGGKMKIHLNRKLLKDFFSSACDILDHNGSIIVALCDGQGGTGADKKKRRWDDSWQITEMAAESDLILHRVEPFDISCFPQYVNNGFRSCDKSFHCNNAVVHTFKKQNVPHILQDCPHRWLNDGSVKVEHIFEFLDERMVNPFSNPQSASSYIYDILSARLGSNFYTHKPVLKYIATVPSGCKTDLQSCINNQIDIEQQSMLNIYLSLHKECLSNNVISRVLVKRAVVKDFSICPMKCQMVVFGNESYRSVLLEHITQTLLDFNSDWQLIFKEINSTYKYAYVQDKNEPFRNINILDVIVLTNGITCHICHIDELAQVLFKIDDWRLLWNSNIDCSDFKSPTFIPISLFPRSFSFDLGLSVPLSFKDTFEEQLYLRLWLLAGDIITKTELISTYLPSDRDLICFCYRMTFKSFNAPLYRKRVIYIHEKIIAHHISKSLRINIT